VLTFIKEKKMETKEKPKYVTGEILRYAFEVINASANEVYPDGTHTKVTVIFNREDGPLELDAFRRTNKKVRSRKVISCLINLVNMKNSSENTNFHNVPKTYAICRPPDKFDQEEGMRFALQKAIKLLMVDKLKHSTMPILENDEKPFYARLLNERFRDRRYYHLLDKKKENVPVKILEPKPVQTLDVSKDTEEDIPF
jgi:hypothetical protein